MGESRIENILEATIAGEPYTEQPQSRIEALLIELKAAIEGGGGGTPDYTQLSNKPQINGATLEGNKSSAELKLPYAETSYIELASGIREYLSTTVPTGDIPTGSVGMGFDDGVYTYKSGTKVSEGEPTANLFDKAKAIIGKYASTSGEITVAGAAHSDYISVVAGQNYYIYGVVPRTTYTQAVGYDADKLNPIVLIVSDSYSGTNGIIEIPTGVEYIIINCKEENLGIVQVSRSSTPLPYEPYGAKKFPFYANGQNLADYVIYGNDGGVGDEVTDSESAHYGEYDIPVICGTTTTHIYLASPLGANDSIDYATAQVAIPTTDGANNLICDTIVQPSKVSLAYTGWHSDLDEINSRLAAIEQAIANGKE